MGEFRCVGLAEQDAASGLQSLDGDGVLFRHVMLQQQGAECRADTLGLQDVLDQKRHAFKRAGGLSGGAAAINFARHVQGLFIQRADRVNHRIDRLDAGEKGGGYFARAYAPVADGLGDTARRPIQNVIAHHSLQNFVGQS